MKCLIDYIGVNACGVQEPESGLYINQLPGITLKSIDSIANEEQVTWAKVWEDVQARSARRFELYVNKIFAARYKLNKLVKSVCLNSTDYETDPVTIEGKWNGFTIKMDEVDSNLISAFKTIFIPSVNLYAQAADADYSIKVFDMNTGATLYDSGDLTSTAIGWKEHKINQHFYSNWIFVAYKASDFTSLKLEVAETTNGNACPCLVCDDCTVTVQGAYSDSLEDPTNITTGTNSFGITGCFNVACSFYSLVCRNKELFSGPWMCLLGSELMTERIYSERMNRFTTIGKKEAEELKDLFFKDFEDQVKEAIAGIQLDDNDCCLSCNPGEVNQEKSVM